MIILGIDPGSRFTGYAVIEELGNSLKYIDSGVIRFDVDLNFIDRFGDFYEKMKQLVEKYMPDEIAIESLIFTKNPSSLMKLAQARGAMLAAIYEANKGKIFEYSPNLIKSTASGYGHASKEGVKKVLDILLGPREYETSDESDAAAIAICHIFNKGKAINNRANKSSSLSKNLGHLDKRKK